MVHEKALSVRDFNLIASTKDFLLQLWKGNMSACADMLATDYFFVGPFEGSLGIGASKFVELRIKLQPLFQRLEYETQRCEVTYRDANTSICFVVVSVSNDAKHETKLTSVAVWKDTLAGIKLAQLIISVPVGVNFMDTDYGRSMGSAIALANLPTWEKRPLVMKDSSGRNHVVDPARTSYLEARHQYSMVHTAPEPFKMRESLTSTLGRFPSYFVRVHRSYAVNALMVSSIGRDEINLTNGERVPIPVRQSTAIRSLILSTISNALGGPAGTSDGLASASCGSGLAVDATAVDEDENGRPEGMCQPSKGKETPPSNK